MSTATIEKGSKVQVTVTGEYSHAGLANGRHILTDSTGKEINVPSDATVRVIEKPLPKEPGRNSMVAPSWDRTDVWGRNSYGWHKISDGTYPVKYKTWTELNALYGRGELRTLVFDPTAGAVDLNKDKVTLTFFGWNGKSTLTLSRNSYGELLANFDGYTSYPKNDEFANVAKAILAKTGN